MLCYFLFSTAWLAWRDKCARNIQRVRSTTSDSLNTYEILWPDVLVFTKDGYEKFEQRLSK